MTETPNMTAASPRQIASCGAYRVLADSNGFQLEKLARIGSLPSHWERIAARLSHADLVAAYQKETGLFSQDLMALSGATFDDDSGLA
tara:strand:- start:89 stop:352 length:264 start_codon:yes stop_codon:yes gene_type:complete